ncbi:hypothetical protein BK124_11475 [Paenibacillus amylolyticus]|uniref:hypothetical protein n=1 Tax=Paenibacillus amylolyticus TaxID=1451 RepID=UPI00096E3F72|nr:hypothetical protein [Paenibacillus amylolyticus]OMF00272.1 hypothetical protein BK124_11475 [Paenibacillus amylolyticus]
MAANNDLIKLELALWEATMEQAAINFEHAKKFDDYGAMEFNEELIRWARIKIAEIEDYLGTQKGA